MRLLLSLKITFSQHASEHTRPLKEELPRRHCLVFGHTSHNTALLQTHILNFNTILQEIVSSVLYKQQMTKSSDALIKENNYLAIKH